MGVMLLISSLEHGGAERQVIELMRTLDRDRFAPFVCSLSSYVPLAEGLPDTRRDLEIVEKRWKYDVTTIPRAASVMRNRRVSIVQAFLFDAEMVGRLAGRLAAVPVVIASERNTDYQRSWVQKTCLRLTDRLFDLMIANSEAGKRFNQRTLGIAPDRIRVVYNGVDIERFRPADRMTARRELGIDAEAMVVGMVAMFKRQKSYQDFLGVARDLLSRFPQTWFVCVGGPLPDGDQDSLDYHHEMKALAGRLGLASRCLFLGTRNDMPEVYSMCDVTVLTSTYEGTPNVLLESMACGVPVVATDASDNPRVVPDGRVGFLVPVGDTAQMSARVGELLADPSRRCAFGARAREWVTREFSTGMLARRTEEVYLEALRRKTASH